MSSHALVLTMGNKPMKFYVTYPRHENVEGLKKMHETSSKHQFIGDYLTMSVLDPIDDIIMTQWLKFCQNTKENQNHWYWVSNVQVSSLFRDIILIGAQWGYIHLQSWGNNLEIHEQRHWCMNQNYYFFNDKSWQIIKFLNFLMFIFWALSIWQVSEVVHFSFQSSRLHNIFACLFIIETK